MPYIYIPMHIMNQKLWKVLLSALVLTAGTLFYEAKAQGVSVRTNLLWDAVSEPNVGLEFPVSDHWSVGANAGIKSWPRWLAWDWDTENPTHWRNLAVVPEARYYFDQVYPFQRGQREVPLRPVSGCLELPSSGRFLWRRCLRGLFLVAGSSLAHRGRGRRWCWLCKGRSVRVRPLWCPGGDQGGSSRGAQAGNQPGLQFQAPGETEERNTGDDCSG